MNFKNICLVVVLIIVAYFTFHGYPTVSIKETAIPETTSKKEPVNETKQDVLLQSEADVKPVVLFFYTEWCGGCKRFKPTYYAVKNRVVGYRYVEVDADKNDKLSQHFNIRSIPTVYIYDKKNNYKGKVNINNFEKELRKYLDNRK